MFPHPPAPLTPFPSPPGHSVADLMGQGSDKTLETALWALEHYTKIYKDPSANKSCQYHQYQQKSRCRRWNSRAGTVHRQNHRMSWKEQEETNFESVVEKLWKYEDF